MYLLSGDKIFFTDSLCHIVFLKKGGNGTCSLFEQKSMFQHVLLIASVSYRSGLRLSQDVVLHEASPLSRPWLLLVLGTYCTV